MNYHICAIPYVFYFALKYSSNILLEHLRPRYSSCHFISNCHLFLGWGEGWGGGGGGEVEVGWADVTQVTDLPLI